MKIFDLQQASGWCAERGIASTFVGKRVELRYTDDGQRCIRATLSTQSPPLIAMALLLQDLAEPDPEDFGAVWCGFASGVYGMSTLNALATGLLLHYAAV